MICKGITYSGMNMRLNIYEVQSSDVSGFTSLPSADVDGMEVLMLYVAWTITELRYFCDKQSTLRPTVALANGSDYLRMRQRWWKTYVPPTLCFLQFSSVRFGSVQRQTHVI